ncbi:hypothetical protein Maes01_02101 [Microbulbifer aestuariivivens]|uniref:Asparagine synthetase domain-containing protein n=1 Tax=Microbulbifer aestuariivivens TaxID=1908308 RepID=A0ABP9WSU6_9GAMM
MNYPKQFALASRPLKELPGWKHTQLDCWWLSVAREVPVIKVVGEQGQLLSVVIGWSILRGRLLQDGESITSRCVEDGAPDCYNEICGRFICFSFTGGDVLVRTDPGGLLGLVYNSGQQILASSPAILELLAPQREDPEVRRALSGGKGEVWYPMGVTPYVGVQRLLPNHALALGNWSVQRVFPLPGGRGRRSDPGCNPQESIARIGEILKANVKALVDDGHFIAHLTGGRDSRMILAASRDWHQQMQFQIIAMDQYYCQLDCQIAADIAEQFDLNFRQLPFLKPSSEEVTGWLQRVGGCVEDTVAALCKTVRVNDSNSHEITGTCGEALRAPYWYPGDDVLTALTAEGLLNRMDIVINPYTLALADKWLAGMPADMSAGNILDLAYSEIRAACWAGPTVYGHEQLLPSISPFNCGDYYREILDLPETFRLGKKAVPAVVAYLWPELAAIPYNRARGLGKLRFIRQEIRLALPIELRDWMKRTLQRCGISSNPLRGYQS